MKKTLISLAVLAAASNVAFAQSSVTIYGTVDAGIVSERGGNASVTKISSGVGSASRLGFRGTEDLGSGLSAVFVLEGGILVDTGASDVAGSIANRQSFVGLKSATAGSLTLGRQYTPWYNTITQVADPFAAGYAGSAKNLMGASGSNVRTSNSLVYATPSYQGFNGEVSYSLGEQAGDNKAARQYGASLGYANGPLNIRLAHNNKNNDAATATLPAADRALGRNTMLAANYDFQVVKAFVSYGQNKGFASSPLPNNTNPFGYAVAPVQSGNSRDGLVGATVPVGSGVIMASYIYKDDRESFNRDANQIALGYTQNLSKRTSAYVAFAKIKNKNGAGYTVGNNTEVGSGDKAFNLGVRHSF
ncbi:MAG: porin [Pseudomonadota bacterium]